jgi:hypothetical protein
MAVRGTVSSAILILAAGVPLGGALIVGGIGVSVVAALLAVLSVGVGGADDPHPGGSQPYDSGSDPTLRSGGYAASGGWHDYGGSDGGGDGGRSNHPPNLRADRAFALAASSSLSLGAAAVSSEASNRSEILAMSSTAE